MAPQSPFFQAPPLLGDVYATDRLLRGYVKRVIPDDARRVIEPELAEMGAISQRLYQKRVSDYRAEPKLVQWDPWGQRVDTIGRASKNACQARCRERSRLYHPKTAPCR